MACSEFELIRRYFSAIATGSPAAHAVALGVGDDCALLNLAAGQQLAISMDTLNSGVHFPDDAPPKPLGYRALAVAASDLAAMGAQPLAFTLSLSLPEANEPWVRDFSAGLADCATALGLPLVGGDTTRGPLSIAVQVHGQVPAGKALTRSGAKPGDRIMVSGSVGDGAAGLAVIQQRLTVSEADSHYLWQRFYQPQARLALGQALRGIATAAIDISDGLLADLGHILHASHVGATLYADQLPLSAALQGLADTEQARQWALSGGDDYELCFTVPEQALAKLTVLSQQQGLPLTEVGVITADHALRCLGGNGQALMLPQQGYQHF